MHNVPSPPRVWLDRPFFWLALTLGVLHFGIHVYASWIVYRYGQSAKAFGWDVAPSGHGWVITPVATDPPAAGKLQIRDRSRECNRPGISFTSPGV
jgi:hypothetical protein